MSVVWLEHSAKCKSCGNPAASWITPEGTKICEECFCMYLLALERPTTKYQPTPTDDLFIIGTIEPDVQYPVVFKSVRRVPHDT